MLGSCGTYGLACMDVAENNDKIVALTADLCYFSGLDRFSKTYPNKFINVGIAEQNMLGIAAGLSKEGFNVFASTYASFATTRSLDQVKVNMSYMQLPIKLVGLTSGFSVGILGATHISIEDLAIMRSLPNIMVLSPADCLETYKCIMAAANTNMPVYIRLTGTMNNPIVYNEDYEFKIGKAKFLKEDGKVAIIATGTMVYRAKKVVEQLEDEGVHCKLINMHTIKPLDLDLINDLQNESEIIITIEEHSKIGGLGSAIAEVLSNRPRTRLVIIGVEDFYPLAGDYNYQCDISGLTEKTLYNRIRKEIDNGKY